MKLDVVAENDTLAGLEVVGVVGLAELGWSPNSMGFFVNESLGGAVGEWRVAVYLLDNGKIRAVDAAKVAMIEFSKSYNCLGGEDPNIGAIKWLEGSNRLLLVAEVPPHSSCPEMGNIEGYIVDIPSGSIIKILNERELLTNWGSSLGKRFEHKLK
jgi:hypothetical protein